MVNVGSFDAKTHLTALLERVIKGETIQITRRGVPVAKLVPVQAAKTHDAKEAAAVTGCEHDHVQAQAAGGVFPCQHGIAVELRLQGGLD